jgi:hemerythrin-like domain-containing protein
MLTLNTKPDHDFDEPLGLMGDCHRRVEKFLDQLLAVAEACGGEELSPREREALATGLRYFQQAAPLHTADEEASLFPRLRAQGALSDEVRDAMARLESDHDKADTGHAEVEELGQRWLNDGTLSPDDAERLTQRLRELRAFYTEHIALEDNYLFPLAAQVLGEAEIENVGREMAARRGIDFDAPNRLGRCAARRQTAK